MRKYTWNEIKNNKYIVINDMVYDINDFLDEHPGGRSILEQWVGRDATDAFNEIGHSESALAQAKEHCIGELDLNSVNITQSESSLSFYVLGFVLVAILSIVIYAIVKK